MKTKKVLVGLVAGAALIGLAACGNSTSSTTSSSANLSGKIVAGGSTALQPLAQAASTEFMAKNPNVQITVQGGGSGTGLTQVSSGSFQIGNSDIFAEQKSGIDASKLTDNKVAVVGDAAIVNSKNGVSNLTKAQLTDIFTGKVTNWSQVGGSNEKITVIGRTAGSGTRVTFDNTALGGDSELSTEATQDASGSVTKLVAQTPGAISYVAFSYTSDSGIKALKLDGVAPTYANVETNAYPVWSYEHMYTLASKTTAADKAFIKFLASDTADLKKLGYIPVTDMKVTMDSNGKVSK
ncbi:MAG: phosphate ABC transporter substrate-binding protein [Streptococcaceae bacterium]|jgi:phosphate transport system substrate-binding protein|nr:phosphate ABC transporter substrate-binding protein [Streptococcaceae bacterium]